ncbi:MAG: hypothetical protein HKP40_11515 [Litoreibacter sp.]|nr:hypothetical protein [Litoreibacter sp.]
METERRFKVFLTGYSWWDNTPRGSAAIAKPVIHRKASGTGTYEDPITLAVGHRIDYGRQTMDYPAGTRFYFPNIRKYAIVEDVCGDGNRPQVSGCHRGYKGHPWLDIYIGGRWSSAEFSDQCARNITAVQDVVMHPSPNYPVITGEVARSNCKALSGIT